MSKAKPVIPDILFEDPNLIVLNKPPGLLSQGEIQGDPNLVDWLRERLGRPYVGLIHRLDRNTSGAMVVAKRTKAAQRLTDSLQKGLLQRTYIAWVEGKMPRESRWKHSLLKDERQNKVRVVKEGGKAAALLATPVASGLWAGAPLTLVRFVLETGRSHQIRAQAAHEGLPLLGDKKYGAAHPEFGRPALHSLTIEFPHPITRELLRFEAPIPEDMSSVRRIELPLG